MISSWLVPWDYAMILYDYSMVIQWLLQGYSMISPGELIDSWSRISPGLVNDNSRISQWLLSGLFHNEFMISPELVKDCSQD